MRLGRMRFFELMRATGDQGADYRDLFRVKLSNFGHVGEEDRRSILADYRAFVARIVTHSAAMSVEVIHGRGLATAERPYVLQAIDHQRHLAASEIAWLERLSRDLEAKDLGVDDEDNVKSSRTVGPKLAGKRSNRAGTRPRSKSRR